MSEGDAFHDLVGRLRAGDGQAAADLVRLYEDDVRRVIRLRLRGTQLRRLVDSVDIWQSIWPRFYLWASLGQADLETPEQLRQVLVTMALNNLRDKGRREQRHAGSLPDGLDVAAPEDVAGRVAAAQELLQEFRTRLSPEERRLADERAAGRAWADIARDLGGSPNALRMRLTRAFARVAAELGLEEHGHD
jgi:DNA-directed RNA polymerase specialized sigma24 family protein